MTAIGAERAPRLWGWGDGAVELAPAELSMLEAVARSGFGVDQAPVAVPTLRDFRLPRTRVTVPAALDGVMTAADADRISHAWGKSFPDLARSLTGDVRFAPDLVAYPATEADVIDVLDWATGSGVAVIPFGGGTSVVGGVTPDVGRGFPGTVSLDLRRLDRVLEVDSVSLAATVQAGVRGPALAEQLRIHGLTLRHYPQSYEFSTLGGWIATRAGGHFATGPTHIDDFVESVRMVAPAGVWESRRLPASGAGPEADRWVLGSEGALGVITSAWVRVQRPPEFRSAATALFRTWPEAVAAVRAIAQSGLDPANCRLLDRTEALNTLSGDGTAEVLILGFESADHDVSARLDRALELCGDHGGAATGRAGADSGDAGRWRQAFVRMPYYRDVLLRYGLISETFETAVTWDRFDELHAAVTGAVTRALASEGLAPASVSCRLTHVYPDGAAPYFTVLAKGTAGDLDRQWWTVKQAAGEAIASAGGTITHHHAVGRDHTPWYRAEVPDLFAASLVAVREQVDPRGIMNPGVLV